MSTGVINLNGSLDFDVMGGREHQITITAVVSSMNIARCAGYCVAMLL